MGRIWSNKGPTGTADAGLPAVPTDGWAHLPGGHFGYGFGRVGILGCAGVVQDKGTPSYRPVLGRILQVYCGRGFSQIHAHGPLAPPHPVAAWLRLCPSSCFGPFCPASPASDSCRLIARCPHPLWLLPGMVGLYPGLGPPTCGPRGDSAPP